MKKQLTLVILLSLVACGGKSGGGAKAIYSTDAYRTALSKQEVGMVTESIETGVKNEISYCSIDKDHFPKRNSKPEISKKIILKIDGDLVYKYSEYSDGFSTSKTVILESLSLEADRFSSYLSQGTEVINGDRIIVSTSIDTDSSKRYFEGLEATLDGGSRKLDINFSASNPLCDFEITETVKDQIFWSSKTQAQRNLEESIRVEKGTCPPPLSKAELKAIDLSHATFCDNTGNGDDSCKQRDMSFLTSDL